ncbi:hypothetical protein ABN080_16900 [Proteus sp. fly-1089]|uniref:hypothetical protein n=1 Tax=Proteus sp. fly-1089 TaxID=3136675 RepID=UPI0032DA0245
MPTVIDSHRSFILSITDIKDKANRKSIEFNKNDISLFFKKGNDDIFIFNDDKKILLNKIKEELNSSINKYINQGENKKHIQKLENRINSGGIHDFFNCTGKIVSVKNINEIGDIERIFTGLLSYKKNDSLFTKVGKRIYNTSSLEKVIFNDKNKIINSFINNDGKFYKIDNINEKLDDKSKGGNKFLNLFSAKSNKVGFYGFNLSIMKVEEGKNVDHGDNILVDKDNLPIDDFFSTEIKRNKYEINLIKDEFSFQFISNKKIADITFAINKIVDFLALKELSKIEVDMLTRSTTELKNKIDIIYELDSNEKIEDKNKLDKYQSSLIEIKRIKNENCCCRNLIYNKGILLLMDVDEKLKKYPAKINSSISKENILLHINEMAVALFINNSHREDNSSFFSKVYKALFPKSYQKKLDVNSKMHSNIMNIHESLNTILNSDDFKNGDLPEWANRLITKVLKDSKPKNDIFWFFSKERKEWNKLYNMLFIK